jgi:hypothetical protein
MSWISAARRGRRRPRGHSVNGGPASNDGLGAPMTKWFGVWVGTVRLTMAR